MHKLFQTGPFEHRDNTRPWIVEVYWLFPFVKILYQCCNTLWIKGKQIGKAICPWTFICWVLNLYTSYKSCNSYCHCSAPHIPQVDITKHSLWPSAHTAYVPVSYTAKLNIKIYNTAGLQDISFLQWRCWRFIKTSGTWHCVTGHIVCVTSKNHRVCIFRAKQSKTIPEDEDPARCWKHLAHRHSVTSQTN